MEQNLKPKDWVLVRMNGVGYYRNWTLNIFSHYDDEKNMYITTGGVWEQCIPYEGNEELLGTNDSPKEKYEPKDGDFVFNDDDGDIQIFIMQSGVIGHTYHSHFGIFKNKGGKEFLKIPNLPNIHTYWNPRPATDEEKDLLLSKLHEIGKDWDAENKKIIDYKWQPKKGDEYYILQYSSFGDEFSPLKMCWNNAEYDKGRMKEGIAYRTKKECQKVCDRRNKVINNIK